MVIFEESKRGRRGAQLPESGVPEFELDVEDHLIRPEEEPGLPEVTEPQVVRHFIRLSSLNYSVDTGFYPLGSCTMKYNPKVHEFIVAAPHFTHLHPYQRQEDVQGALRLMYELQEVLCEITGMDAFTLQPAAGAHGELTGMLMVKKFFEVRGENNRRKVLIPDSAHGTNPASAVMAGFEVVEIKSGEDGLVDLNELRKNVGDDTAALMLTNPNTLGLFEKEILKISEMIHDAGALLYYDGANLNAIMGYARPGDMGFDIVHLNLHKTFSTPHGMGGPGSGPVGVKTFLKEFLPVPVIVKDGERYRMDYDLKHSIGKVRSFYANFTVLLKAYAYILSMGGEGLKRVSQLAVLNANYLKTLLSRRYRLKYDHPCMHEFVLDNEWLTKRLGVKTLDIAKRLLDKGFHAPTIYFPLIVHEAMMIEPTETETKDTLDAFARAMFEILDEAERAPELLKKAPLTTPVSRFDEVAASRHPEVAYRRKEVTGS